MAATSARPNRTLDDFDRAILRIIQIDNKTPQRRIAEAVHLSAAAVQRRIAAMEAAGVIERNVAVIAPEMLSLAITAIVEIHLSDERAATVDAAKALFAAEAMVQQVYYATGGVSFVLIILCRDMREYEALTRRIFSESNLVANFRTLVALDRVKAGNAVIVP